MIIVTKKDVTPDELDHIRERIESLGLRTHMSRGEHRTVIGCLGDEAVLEHVALLSIPGVEDVHEVLKPYKLASKEFSAEPTEVAVGDLAMGGKDIVVIAGPCSVEAGDMLSTTARHVHAAGGRALRGGAFKPRSSPYSFQEWARTASRCFRTCVARRAYRLSLRSWTRVRSTWWPRTRMCFRSGLATCRTFHS